MKQKNTSIGKAFLCGGAAMLLLAGCVKESAINEKYRPAGTPITFSAATGYENGTGTRTEYSGQLYDDTQRYERIDWVADDPVTIVYAQGTGTPTTSQYIVTEVSGDTDRNSYASVEVAEGQTKLTWGEGDGDHTFYAMYPSNGFGENDSANLTGNHVTGSIPAVQTPHVKDDKYLPPMQYGYMVAYKNIGSTDHESRVTLPFTPAVTAFEFKLQRKAGDEDLKVTDVELTATTPLTGTFAFDITGNNDGATWNAPTVTDEGYTVSFSFPVEGGVSVPEVNDNNNYLDFTLFGLPVEQTGLVLKLIYADGSFKRLALNNNDGSPHDFAAAKKHIITNTAVPGGEFEYVLQHTDSQQLITLDDGTVVQVVVRNYDTAGATSTALFDSYRTSGEGSARTSVPVTLEYAEADADGLPVRDPDSGEIVWSSNVASGLSSVSSPLSDSGAGTFSANVTAYSPGNVKETVNEFLKRAENLKSRGAVGTSDSPRDLSMYDIHGTSRSNQPVTANSYVVDRAGWYMFPLVYGNAIDYTKSAAPLYSNGVNAYAYKDATSPAVNEIKNWHNFQNFRGTSLISTPYVLDDCGSLTYDKVEAVVVWQDVESSDYSFIENVSVVDVPSSNIFYDPRTSEYKSSVPYIKFQVPLGDIDTDDETTDPLQRVTGIRQGNALIAVRLKEAETIGGTSYPAETILWSWHIWITDGFDADGDYKGDGLASIPVTNYENVTLNMMPVNMGWFDTKTTTYYKDRVWYVRMSQSTGSVEPIVFRVVQKKAPKKTFGGSGTYYEWGRKDPFLPSNGSENVNKAAYSPAGYTLTASTDAVIYSGGPAENASTAIQNPFIIYSGSVNVWMMGSVYPKNLWNMANGTSSEDVAVSKTVYDPCPPGYSVPRKNAFTGFTTTGVRASDTSQWNVEDRDGDGTISSADFEGGLYFYTNSSKERTIFIPTTGHRNPINRGAVNWITVYSNLWLASPTNSNNIAYSFYFNQTGSRPSLNPLSTGPNYWTYGCAIRPVEEQN